MKTDKESILCDLSKRKKKTRVRTQRPAIDSLHTGTGTTSTVLYYYYVAALASSRLVVACLVASHINESIMLMPVQKKTIVIIYSLVPGTR